jgi:hypothetical protein
MTIGEQVELTLLPAESRSAGRIEGVTGRILRVRPELPLEFGTLLKTCWNGNVILGEVMLKGADGSVVIKIRHWLSAVDLQNMSRNWVSSGRKG